MSNQELKTEIHKVFDMLPDDISGDVLSYLKSLLNKPSDKIKISHHLSTILREDDKLLDRLSK
ncbi:MAG TPA: hypothetical protein DDX98_00385 [Bacteroidales bacterium]|jgi:hypothetical protein|nr:hypothetical protein [Bacteroidales bacterium]